MKRRTVKERIDIILGTPTMICDKCRHVREKEPFLLRTKVLRSGGVAFYYTCWRCCRDAESTLLIKQKWPLAFDRFEENHGHRLYWAPGVKELVGGTDGNKS